MAGRFAHLNAATAEDLSNACPGSSMGTTEFEDEAQRFGCRGGHVTAASVISMWDVRQSVPFPVIASLPPITHSTQSSIEQEQHPARIMATEAHCAYCFETIAAHFERRAPLPLARVQALWDEYHASDSVAETGVNDKEADAESAEADENLRTVAISRLLNRNRDPSAASSSSSTPSSRQDSSMANSATSSRSSLLSSGGHRGVQEAYPLFVTWNTVPKRGEKCLRGCIGTFEARALEAGLDEYAKISAFDDTRFAPIPASLLPSLSAHVTLLTNFSTPTRDPLDWTVGIHGLRISFTLRGRRYGSTYLPDVAKEQGWTKEETLSSLMRKAGWSGSSSQWRKAWDDGKGELVRYEGKQVGVEYGEWKEWRDWVDR
nr:uncharacterized protein CFP56_64823 [Quercus suber]